MFMKEKKLMMSLHLKATMMKISDPVLFGHCVQVYYKVKPGFLHNYGPCLNAIASGIACFHLLCISEITDNFLSKLAKPRGFTG
jgi:monomeric isocitrate dehydrogenase